jgi:hypothetical protein
MNEETPKTDRAEPPADGGYQSPEVEDLETGGEPLATMALIAST